MKTLMLAIVSALLATVAQASPFAKGDPKAGKALHDKSCVSCHVSMYGGDGSEIYTRPDRKTKTAEQLAARIAACNVNTNAGWFPEDERNVGAWLNQQYYKFK
jgi:mono/diheme cytochrome c family protein